MLKIGIIISDLNEMMNWELRLIKAILDDKTLNIALLLKEKNVTNTQKPSLFSMCVQFFKHPGKSLFGLQIKLERKFFLFPPTINKKEVIGLLDAIPTLHLEKFEQDEEDLDHEVKSHELDVILKHGSLPIDKNLLNTSKFGVWALDIHETDMYRGGLNGFWEVALKKPFVEIILKQLSEDDTVVKVLDRAEFNRKKSYLNTNCMSLEAAIPLVIKNLSRLSKEKPTITEHKRDKELVQKYPSLYYLFKYQINFIKHFFSRSFELFALKHLNFRYECWTLLIGDGSVFETPLKGIAPLKLPKNEFWADPFFFDHQGQRYVFFENFSYMEKRGKISCGRMENKKLVDVCDVLDLDFHLSYPYIFEENGEIFMMPETSNNRKLMIYKCTKFPDQWEEYNTAFDGEIVFDATFFDDDQNQKWLFVNKMKETTAMDAELYIYKVDSIDLNTIEAHENNPVIISSRTARNGGGFFKYNGHIYRASQYNGDGVYGRGLNLNKITELSLEAYKEETVKTIMPDFIKGTNATHHLHQVDDMFIMDVAYRRMMPSL